MEGEEDPPHLPESMSGLTVERFIGRGAFGSVWECRRESGESVALKYMDCGGSEMNLSSARREVDALQQCGDCELIVTLHQHFFDGPKCFLVLDLLGHSLLHDLSRASTYTEAMGRGYLLQLTQAIQFLHAHHLAHLDIKLDNVMLRQSEPQKICLIDFGFCVPTDGTPIKILVGTPDYQAPEVHALEAVDPRAADIWALGVVAYALLTGDMPFAHRNRFVLATMIKKFQALDPEAVAHLSDGAKGFLSSLLRVPVTDRLTADQSACHPWLASPPTLPTAAKPISGFASKADSLRRQAEARRQFRKGVMTVMAAALLRVRPKKVAVVTGGRQGLGGAIVRKLLETGEFGRIFFSSRVECSIPGAECIVVKDFSVAGNVKAFALEVEKRSGGRVDVLFNNAGVFMNQQGSFLTTSPEEMHLTFSINTVAPVLLMQHFIPLMEKNENGGWIINISSSQGALYGMGEGNLAYRMSKASLNCATIVASTEHSPNWIRINSVCPGFVATEMTSQLKGVDLTHPDDAAEQLMWLLAEDAPTGGFFSNGTSIYW